MFVSHDVKPAVVPVAEATTRYEALASQLSPLGGSVLGRLRRQASLSKGCENEIEDRQHVASCAHAQMRSRLESFIAPQLAPRLVDDKEDVCSLMPH